jgi:hypothetical protein
MDYQRRRTHNRDNGEGTVVMNYLWRKYLRDMYYNASAQDWQSGYEVGQMTGYLVSAAIAAAGMAIGFGLTRLLS